MNTEAIIWEIEYEWEREGGLEYVVSNIHGILYDLGKHCDITEKSYNEVVEYFENKLKKKK